MRQESILSKKNEVVRGRAGAIIEKPSKSRRMKEWMNEPATSISSSTISGWGLSEKPNLEKPNFKIGFFKL